MSRHTRVRVLFIELEFTTWRKARHQSYASQLGIEEGLRANGVDCLTITTPWLSRAQEICAGRRFDQVWIEVVHGDLDETFLQWLATVAPVRIGMMAESLEYSPEVYSFAPYLKERRAQVERRLKYLTHAIACDEEDANELNARQLVRAMWQPPAVPERFIREADGTDAKDCAVFSGALYGERANWLKHPDLKGLLVHQPSPEDGTPFPRLFNALHFAVRAFLKNRLPGNGSVLFAYLCLLRCIRRKCFALWLEGMQTGRAVVNLPHWVKGYPGRVVEGMAAGRPVISWEVPDRPQNKALFEDGREILLYPQNDPAQLAVQIRRILSDPDLGQRIVANARRKLLRFHTMERRVRQILDWVETGETPIYG